MPALTVTNLTKIYSRGVIALDNINLTVAEGDFFALLGPNGAGKSTTIGILSSLINKTSGTVSVFNFNIDTDFEKAKSCIGIVPQEINFNPFEKVLENIINQAGYYGISRKIATPNAEIYLKKLELWGKRNHRVMHLSGGMKRRLMIVRALINKPRLLILDEPTAGVDIELRHTLWEFLTELNQQGTTIILTTHYLEEAENLCRNIAIIDHGRIIENASTKTLINRLPVKTFILEMTNPLQQLPKLDHFTFHQLDNSSIEVELFKGQSLNDLFTVLNNQQIQISNVHNKTNRLEELFIRLIAENKDKSA